MAASVGVITTEMLHLRSLMVTDLAMDPTDVVVEAVLDMQVLVVEVVELMVVRLGRPMVQSIFQCCLVVPVVGAVKLVVAPVVVERLS